MITNDIDIDKQQCTDLASLLSIYSIVQERINNYENRASDTSIVNFSVIVVLLGVNFLNPTALTDAGVVWFIFPMITMAAHYQFSFYTRFSAVLQGYSAYLEDLMNNYHSVPFFLWNKTYVNEFFAPKKFRTNSLAVAVFSSFAIVPNIYFFIRYSVFSVPSCISEKYLQLYCC